MQITYLTRDSYPEYIKNSQNSTAEPRFKLGSLKPEFTLLTMTLYCHLDEMPTLFLEILHYPFASLVLRVCSIPEFHWKTQYPSRERIPRPGIEIILSLMKVFLSSELLVIFQDLAHISTPIQEAFSGKLKSCLTTTVVQTSSVFYYNRSVYVFIFCHQPMPFPIAEILLQAPCLALKGRK